MTITPINNNILPATLASGATVAIKEAVKQEDTFKADLKEAVEDISSQTRPVEETTNDEPDNQNDSAQARNDHYNMITQIRLNGGVEGK